MPDPIRVVVLGSPPWWVGAIVQFAAVLLAFILGAWQASKQFEKQARSNAIARTEERKLAEENAKWQAKWQLLSGRVDVLDRLLREISAWASKIRVGPYEPSGAYTAELLTIDMTLQAVYPMLAQSICACLYEHHDYCVNTHDDQRTSDTLNRVFEAVQPIIDARKRMAHELTKMMGLVKPDGQASSPVGNEDQTGGSRTLNIKQ